MSPRTMFVLAAHIFCASTAFAQSWAPTFAAVAPAVLPLESATADGDSGRCTAVVINADAGYVITAAHCVPTGSDISITVGGRHAETERVNRLLDLAVLKAKLKVSTQLVLADDAPIAGAPVAIVGYAFGAKDLSLQVGIVANPRETSSRRMWINADIIPGDSGGAVVSADGQLLAIASSIHYVGPAHMGEGIPLETIRDFVEKYLPGASK